MDNYVIGMIGGLLLLVLFIAVLRAWSIKKNSPTKEFGTPVDIISNSKYQAYQNAVEAATVAATSESDEFSSIVAFATHDNRIGTRVRNPVTGRMKNYNEKHPSWREGLDIQP